MFFKRASNFAQVNMLKLTKRHTSNSSRNYYSLSFTPNPTLKKVLVALGYCSLFGLPIYNNWTTIFPQRIIGPPSPQPYDTNNPNRLVYQYSELTDAGPGDGREGRSTPVKKQINDLTGYQKTFTEGRTGFLNELIYHRFAERVLGEHHPKVKLIENKLNDKESEYFLFIESIGRNSNLKQYAAQYTNVLKNSDDPSLANLVIHNLGCAIAFTCLIRSTDAFMKNFVIIHHDPNNNAHSLYPIDFELMDDGENILFADLESDSMTAARKLIQDGGILDFKTTPNLSERSKVISGDESDVGSGYKRFHQGVYDLIERSCARDIENGAIDQLYLKVASMTESDVDSLFEECMFLLTEQEKNTYKANLLTLIEATHKFMETKKTNKLTM